MPMYQGQPTALAAPIMPVATVSAALYGSEPKNTSSSRAQNAPMLRRKRFDAMDILPKSPALLWSRQPFRLVVRFKHSHPVSEPDEWSARQVANVKSARPAQSRHR